MKKSELQEAIQAYEKLQAKSRAIFSQVKEAKAAIVAGLLAASGRSIAMPDGTRRALEDKFLDADGEIKQTVFKTTAIDRWEIITVA